MKASRQRFAMVRQARGLTLVELLIATGVSSVILACAASLWLFGSRSFVAMGNYTDLDARSRNAVDRMSREIRQATRVIAFQKGSSTKSLVVTNALAGTAATYIWDADLRQVIAKSAGRPDQVYLTDCDGWDFELYQRTPQGGKSYVFYPATNAAGVYDPGICKMVNMSWKCSRTILGKKANSESVQTAQVVLRNKQ